MEALQNPSIWIESQDSQNSRSQEVEREVSPNFVQKTYKSCCQTLIECHAPTGSTAISIHTAGGAALWPRFQ